MPKGKRAICFLAGSALALGALAASMPAVAVGETAPPVPAPRPVAGAGSSQLDLKTTAAIPPKPVVYESDRQDVAELKAGLDALSAGDVAAARAARDGLPETALDRHILTWAIAMSGNKDVTSGEISRAYRLLSQWPGAETLRRNGERALAREAPAPQAVIKAFGGTRPQTVEGVTILVRAYVTIGDVTSARAILSPFWRAEKLDASQELAILTEFGAIIPAADHRFRMEKMLYAERARSAERIAALAGAGELARAWSAVLRGDADAGKLLDAVPAAQRSAGYLFAKAKYLRRQQKFEEAAAVMLKAPRDRDALVDPDEWWTERRLLSRELMDRGDVGTAYRVAAAHAAERPANVVDAEFHAGWYALRGLGDAKAAALHFARIAEVADGPISLSRAYYWLGRAAEAGGPGDANAYYRKAAAYGTAFYGQLAAARLGNHTIAVSYPSPTDVDRADFAGREAVRAIGRLEDAGYPARAELLYRDLAQQLTSPGELALLAARAERRGNHFLALRIGKIAAGRGLDIGALSHPIGVIPPTADISGAGKALAYAIARQESEFNVGAVSRAGALGLLQLLPGTAKEVARKNGMPYSKDRLTTDAGYNATLGAAFLRDQLGKFDGSYILTFAGYNAGPRRASEWIAEYGDPRGKDLDTVIDWIERVPFTETRSYIQRVMENYQVYKMRLTGRFDIAGDLVSGRAQ